MPAYLTWLHVVPQFNWGAFGVALFFLISGFVIPFSLSRQRAGAFLVGRFFRIVPLYVVGFTISLAAIGATTLYFARSWPFFAKLDSNPLHAWAPRYPLVPRHRTELSGRLKLR